MEMVEMQKLMKYINFLIESKIKKKRKIYFFINIIII